MPAAEPAYPALQFIKDYWTILAMVSLAAIGIGLRLFGSGLKGDNLTLVLLSSFIAFSIAESIRQLAFRYDVARRLDRFTEVRVISGAVEYFAELLRAFKSPQTTHADMCYFTQRPPTEFYHLPEVKRYWEETLRTLRENSNKTMLRMVLVTNDRMAEWLRSHVTEHDGVTGYCLRVLTSETDYQLLSLCLTNNGECHIFSPHSPDASPSYIWIRDDPVYSTLKVAYSRMWERGVSIIDQGTVNQDALATISNQFQHSEER